MNELYLKKSLQLKLKTVSDYIKKYDSAVICYSGGVDSTLLCKIAKQLLGEKVVAICGVSPSHPKWELEDAIKYARIIGIELILKETGEFNCKNYLKNDSKRCYYCKSELFHLANQLKEEQGFEVVFDGANADDVNDFRPGAKAAIENKVVSPLKKAGLTKKDIRELLNYFNLNGIALKPSYACLASRIEYGVPVSKELVYKIDKIETFLHEKGFISCRARVHSNRLLRIEVPTEHIVKIAQEPIRNELVDFARKLGFLFVTCDIEGFVSGKMNRVLSIK